MIRCRIRCAVWLMFLFFVIALGYGQERHLSVEAQQLTDAWAELQQKPDDPSVQAQYLAVFPKDYDMFLKLFDPNRELYDGHNFINALPALAKNHELEVGRLLVGLGADAHYEADAASYLQHATATFASLNTQTFARLLEQLSKTKQAGLINFLADVENHSSYIEYQVIIDHLKASGQIRLAKMFEVARETRARQPRG